MSRTRFGVSSPAAGLSDLPCPRRVSPRTRNRSVNCGAMAPNCSTTSPPSGVRKSSVAPEPPPIDGVQSNAVRRRGLFAGQRCLTVFRTTLRNTTDCPQREGAGGRKQLRRWCGRTIGQPANEMLQPCQLLVRQVRVRRHPADGARAVAHDSRKRVGLRDDSRRAQIRCHPVRAPTRAQPADGSIADLIERAEARPAVSAPVGEAVDE